MTSPAVTTERLVMLMSGGKTTGAAATYGAIEKQKVVGKLEYIAPKGKEIDGAIHSVEVAHKRLVSAAEVRHARFEGVTRVQGSRPPSPGGRFLCERQLNPL